MIRGLQQQDSLLTSRAQRRAQRMQLLQQAGQGGPDCASACALPGPSATATGGSGPHQISVQIKQRGAEQHTMSELGVRSSEWCMQREASRSPDEGLRRSFRTREHPNFSAGPKNDPGPAGGPGALPDSGMMCYDVWREGRRTGPVPGCMHARKMRPTNGGRPSGPRSLGRPNGSPPGAVRGTWKAVHNGTNEQRARAMTLP